MRTPSMTTQEAESLLGPRGELRLDRDNRNMVKKWLVANGLPASFCGTLTYAEMNNAYNKLDDSGLESLRAQLARRVNNGDSFEDSDDTEESTDPVVPLTNGAVTFPTPVPPAPPAPSSDASDLFALITRIAGKSLDAAQVAAMIDSKLAPLREAMEARLKALIESAAPSRMEIIINGAVAGMIDGLMHKALPELIAAVGAGLPVFLPGAAGSGKTSSTEQVAKALGLKFYIQGAVSGTHELLGYYLPTGYVTTAFRHAFEHGGLLCLDELDAGDAGALLVLNAALANCYMTFPDSPVPVQRHPDFRVIACANTFGTGQTREYVGRNQLDAATLDRFYFLAWEYDTALESALCGDSTEYKRRTIRIPQPVEMTPAMSTDWCNRVQRLRAAVTSADRLIISPRASLMGIKALAAGLSLTQVENALIWKGTAPDTRNRIARAA